MPDLPQETILITSVNCFLSTHSILSIPTNFLFQKLNESKSIMNILRMKCASDSPLNFQTVYLFPISELQISRSWRMMNMKSPYRKTTNFSKNGLISWSPKKQCWNSGVLMPPTSLKKPSKWFQEKSWYSLGPHIAAPKPDLFAVMKIPWRSMIWSNTKTKCFTIMMKSE